MKMTAHGVRRVSLWVVLAVVALCGYAGQSARAQGTQGMFPDPISAKQLDWIAARLDLSDEQRRAMEQLHETYRAEFADLRDGPMEAYLKAHGGAGNFMMGRDRSVVEDRTNALRDIYVKIRRCDDRFFDQLLTTLSEPQQEQLPRVRSARERERYLSGASLRIFGMGGTMNVELGQLIDELNLSPDASRTVDPLLANYEARLTAAAKDLHELQIGAGLTMFDAMEDARANTTAQTAEDGTTIVMGDGMFDALMAVQNRIGAGSRAIADIHRSELAHILTLLEPDTADRLRMAFMNEAYPDLLAGTSRLHRRVRHALEKSEITEAQRAEILALRGTYRTQRDQLFTKMMDVKDTQSETWFTINPTQEEELRAQRLEQEMDDLQERRGQLVQNTMVALDAILGEALAQSMTRQLADAGEEHEERPDRESTGVFIVAMDVAGDGEDAGDVAANVGFYSTSVTFDAVDVEMNDLGVSAMPAPKPIDRLWMNAQVRDGNLDDTDQAVLDTLYDDYRAQFRTLDDDVLDRLHDAEQATRIDDPQSGTRSLPGKADIQAVYALRRQAHEAVKRTDQAFFEELSLLFDAGMDDPTLRHLRMARTRERCRAAMSNGASGLGPSFFVDADMMFGGGGRSGRDDTIDLAQLADTLDLDPGVRAKLDGILDDYEAQLTTLLENRLQRWLAYHESLDVMSAESTTLTEDGMEREITFEHGADNPLMSNAGAASEARKQIVALNRSTRDALLALLSDVDARALRDAYNRQAHPGAYDDPTCMLDRVQMALDLSDLTASQQSQMRDLAAEYRSAYDAATLRIVELHAAGATGGGFSMSGEGLNWNDMQQHQRDLEKLEFERDDLNNRTRNQLRAILTDEQARQVGGLDEPAG
jgi:Spy/CpxP family protein refolding chaperone